jgi:hypothetical protein
MTFNSKKEIFWEVVAITADVAGLHMLSTEPNSQTDFSKYLKYINSFNYIEYILLVF